MPFCCMYWKIHVLVTYYLVYPMEIESVFVRKGGYSAVIVIHKCCVQAHESTNICTVQILYIQYLRKIYIQTCVQAHECKNICTVQISGGTICCGVQWRHSK